ncbi:MAG: carbohydrate ABC transporter permease [Lachnospiraceae bacterium]|jgi:multiple sugar transport system permease protein|nr:carbohydrate ABC transporter permease [Lachnospiraceae bacterium]
MKDSKKVRVLRNILIVLWIIGVTFPIYWTLITSFKSQVDIYGGPYYFPGIDFTPNLSAWNFLFTTGSQSFLLSLKNSLIISLISSILVLVIGSMAAYGLSRYQYNYFGKNSEDLAATILSQRMMPPIVAVIALFIMFSIINLLDSKVGMIIVYTWMNLPITVYLLKDFFAGIPQELEHAAAVDGYSKFDQIRKIVLPLAAPGLATCFTLAFNFAWNEFLFALILTFQKSQTIPVLISSMNAQMKPEWSIISALGIVAIIPPTFIAIAMDKYLVQGLSFGSATK